MTDQPIPRAEVDALVAAEVALVVQKAAEHRFTTWHDNTDKSHRIKCSCGWEGRNHYGWCNDHCMGDHAADQRDHILALADQNAKEITDATRK